MSERNKHMRDAFTFSLGGISTITSFVAASAIADDRINEALSERFRRARKVQPESAKELTTSWGRFWLRSRRRAAPKRPAPAQT